MEELVHYKVIGNLVMCGKHIAPDKSVRDKEAVTCPTCKERLDAQARARI